METERDKEEKEASRLDQNALPLPSATVTDGSRTVLPEENGRLTSVFTTCFTEVHLSSSHSKIHIIPTPVSFFVLLIKSRVKNKNKNFKNSLGIVKDSDLSCSAFISIRRGQIQENGPHFRTRLNKGNI